MSILNSMVQRVLGQRGQQMGQMTPMQSPMMPRPIASPMPGSPMGQPPMAYEGPGMTQGGMMRMPGQMPNQMPQGPMMQARPQLPQQFNPQMMNSMRMRMGYQQ